ICGILEIALYSLMIANNEFLNHQLSNEFIDRLCDLFLAHFVAVSQPGYDLTYRLPMFDHGPDIGANLVHRIIVPGFEINHNQFAIKDFVNDLWSIYGETQD